MPVGIVLDAQSQLRPHAEIDIVAARWTLLEAPRAPGARALGAAVRAAHGTADLWVYAWHYVTHRPEDGVAGRARRTLTGDHGHFRSTEAVRSAWDTTARLAAESGARGVILRTPASFTPGSQARAALRAFADRSDIPLAWEPEGLWEPEPASDFARELGVRLILKTAFSHELPGRAEDWVAVEQRLGGAARDALAEGLLEGRTVLFAGDPYRSARRARRDADELD
jgi:hypothetical protein